MASFLARLCTCPNHPNLFSRSTGVSDFVFAESPSRVRIAVLISGECVRISCRQRIRPSGVNDVGITSHKRYFALRFSGLSLPPSGVESRHAGHYAEPIWVSTFAVFRVTSALSSVPRLHDLTMGDIGDVARLSRNQHAVHIDLLNRK